MRLALLLALAISLATVQVILPILLAWATVQGAPAPVIRSKPLTRQQLVGKWHLALKGFPNAHLALHSDGTSESWLSDLSPVNIGSWSLKDNTLYVTESEVDTDIRDSWSVKLDNKLHGVSKYHYGSFHLKRYK